MASPPTWSNRQLRALAEMDIDVWIRRAAPVARVIVDAAALAVSAKDPPPPRPDPRPQQQPRTLAAAAVQLECLAAPGAVVVGAFASAADRRFVQDILLTLAGMSAAVARTQFRWPQTQTTDQSVAAARSAYAGFLRGQLDRAGARCLLLFGAAALKLYDASMAGSECSVLCVDDVAVLRGDSIAKKALWLELSQLTRS